MNTVVVEPAHPPARRHPLPSPGVVRDLLGRCQRGIGAATTLERDLTALAVTLEPGEPSVEHSRALAEAARLGRSYRRIGDHIRALFGTPDQPPPAPLPPPPDGPTTGRITVAVSGGQTPTYYLIGPPVEPWTGDPNAGPVLGTVAQTNPRAAADALLWASAWRLRELLAEVVDAHPHPAHATVANAARLLEELA